MLIRFTPKVNLEDVGTVTARCDAVNVQYKYIQEMSTSWLVVESLDRPKIEELNHQLRHLDFVESIYLPDDPGDPFDKIDEVKIKCGNRWLSKNSRPVIFAGSPYLESQKHSVDFSATLSGLGVHVFKAGPYRPTETLDVKSLYERAGSIVHAVWGRSKIPSTLMIEALGPRTALSSLKPCAFHVPGKFMFDTGLMDQMAKLMMPVLLERHPDASTSLWLDMAREIVATGNFSVALLETGRNIAGDMQIDFAELTHLIDTCPLPIIVYASRIATSASQVGMLARASLAAGAAGIMLDVHPNPLEGLLSDGFCLSLRELEEMTDSLIDLCK